MTMKHILIGLGVLALGYYAGKHAGAKAAGAAPVAVQAADAGPVPWMWAGG